MLHGRRHHSAATPIRAHSTRYYSLTPSFITSSLYYFLLISVSSPLFVYSLSPLQPPPLRPTPSLVSSFTCLLTYFTCSLPLYYYRYSFFSTPRVCIFFPTILHLPGFSPPLQTFFTPSLLRTLSIRLFLSIIHKSTPFLTPFPWLLCSFHSICGHSLLYAHPVNYFLPLLFLIFSIPSYFATGSFTPSFPTPYTTVSFPYLI